MLSVVSTVAASVEVSVEGACVEMVSHEGWGPPFFFAQGALPFVGVVAGAVELVSEKKQG